MMDEISILRETFGPDPEPSAAAEQRARTALRGRMAPRARASWRLRVPIAAGVAVAATVVAAVAIGNAGGGTRVTPPVPPQRPNHTQAAGLPYLRPVDAAQVLENAAWTVEQETWTDPAPTQFMYVETQEMRNPPAYEQKAPNGALLPGRARYRKVQTWNRIDGQVQASMRDGRLDVRRQGQDGAYFAFVPWSQIVKLTTPEAIAAYVEHPEGGVMAAPDALAGQYVLPPEVKAAVFRYLARQPGMKVNPDAVNLDGHPAIGLGRVVEGYLSQELLFDRQTYTLIGDRLIAVDDERGTGDGRKGDLYRQVIYRRMAIVDRPGQTG
ncbi:hypothetical protein GCM10020358_72060 [Amorphoplanes nipponensis]|uniref:CU044_5270 family protein n=1 Tax=Actinoplanes nipponensis TaxID=135950 RepID=A0A919JCS3_9ACTN|nr:hypothetical protein [Actinoplanes nipponensis]GIE47005.1 hypothetical protein Ani05nite_05390 [Actinoplanes nipponensis]